MTPQYRSHSRARPRLTRIRWEVAEIVGICRANGYIQPRAYQGIYNAVHRRVEPELFPCLRKFGIAFYEFNPLGGGFFTGRYRSLEDSVEPGSRFDPNKGMGKVRAIRPQGRLVSVFLPSCSRSSLRRSDAELPRAVLERAIL